MSKDTIRDFGVVRRWDSTRAYGFIKPDGAGGDIFVHIRGTRDGRPLEPGQRVSYYLQPDPRDASRVLASDTVVMRP